MTAALVALWASRATPFSSRFQYGWRSLKRWTGLETILLALQRASLTGARCDAGGRFTRRPIPAAPLYSVVLAGPAMAPVAFEAELANDP